MRRFLAAALQMTSTEDRTANIAQAMALVDRAVERGATLVALPENVDLIGPQGVKVAAAEPLDGPTFELFREKAVEKRIWLLAGTIAEESPIPGKARNTAVLFSPDGARAGVYRKMHLFDIDLDKGPSFRESEVVEPGEDVVVAETELARFGMSICYDLRFPELYRELAARGAEVMFIPSAFTLQTGKDHWEVLIRARAIENTSWVIAPAQTGHHGGKRWSWGHAMIVDPWGAVVARCSEGPGLCVAEIEPASLERVRRELPALGHRRM
jgi:deaminated glutathione amidase